MKKANVFELSSAKAREDLLAFLNEELNVGRVVNRSVRVAGTNDQRWVRLNDKAVRILESPEKLHIDKNGYVKKGNAYAHTLIRPRPKGLQVDHKDGNKLNLCYDNLEVVHRQENMRRYFDDRGIVSKSGHRGVYVRSDGGFNVGSGKDSKRFDALGEAIEEADRRRLAKREQYDLQYERLLGHRPFETRVTFSQGPPTEEEIAQLKATLQPPVARGSNRIQDGGSHELR